MDADVRLRHLVQTERGFAALRCIAETFGLARFPRIAARTVRDARALDEHGTRRIGKVEDEETRHRRRLTHVGDQEVVGGGAALDRAGVCRCRTFGNGWGEMRRRGGKIEGEHRETVDEGGVTRRSRNRALCPAAAALQ